MQHAAQGVAEYHQVLQALAEAGKRYRVETAAPKETQLIVVSKTHPAEKIRPLLETGHRLFGENRVQEAAEKWPALRADFSDIELHLIGPLQTNKVKQAVALFDVIETLDREKLAKALKKEMQKQERVLPCFIQVNIGEEEQKAGITPAETAAFYSYCTEELELPVAGLMCIPPMQENPAPYFALMQELKHTCESCYLPAASGRLLLSMGMSGDFELAAAMAADYVRVGSAIFGARQ